VRVGNPIDAFSRDDQRLWISWLEGHPSGERVLAGSVRVVFVQRASPAERRIAADPRFRLDLQDARASVYVRRS
jgi:hypothetical protein